MSIWTSLEPASTTVDPGSTAVVRLRVRNTSDVVDEYRFVPVGDIAPYTTVEPPTIRLYPGTTGTVQLTIAPPRSPDATAGPNPYAVQIVSTEHPEATTVPEGNVTITPFTEVRAELVPPTVKGRFRGRPRLAVDNLGNTRMTASVTGNDNGGQLSYEMRPANIQIEPGRAAFVRATLKPRQIIWLGSKQQRPYRLSVRRSGATPLDVDGVYVQRNLLPRWLAGFAALLLALGAAAVALWLSYSPHVTSLAQAMPQAAVSTITSPTTAPTPVPSPPTTAPTPPPTTAAAAPATTPPSGGDGGGSGGSGGGGGSKPSPKPPADTAATAVKLLAAQSPGRHICYRAYVVGIGWQDPVCDGTMAGTTGQNRPIDSLDIAVSGVNGTAANAFLQDTGWNSKWHASVDGIDLYIGGTVDPLPMMGFAINVGNGSVCQNTIVHGGSWQGLGCDKPGSYIFGGTLDNSLWLEAVQFTV
ncbi:hydrolase [Streptacidiphilus sp. PB12-B1b]|uniref:hydrolase n=1 Tax=Streptacidiphilus sp. PB12-B1b TaxID=2705012 RepID=UPI0015F85CD6|nr:hydrolase [Streptacidiphilus sp. PB12-B1b]QMU76664.1 hydrolase [Streptacidiphilus sp. PB12-B1b]